MSRIEELLEAEARRIDCGDCGKKVYVFFPVQRFGDGLGGIITTNPRRYDRTGARHGCDRLQS